MCLFQLFNHDTADYGLNIQNSNNTNASSNCTTAEVVGKVKILNLDFKYIIHLFFSQHNVCCCVLCIYFTLFWLFWSLHSLINIYM